MTLPLHIKLHEPVCLYFPRVASPLEISLSLSQSAEDQI